MIEGVEPGVGGLLAQTRQAKGMTTAEVAEKLKLTARQIEAIEGEEYDKLPAAVFVRGFIRNYARLLGLDADRLLAAMGEAQGATATITAPSEGVTISSSPLKRWMIYLIGGAALFLLLVALLYEWLSTGEDSFVVQPVTPETTVPASGSADTVTPVTPPSLVTPAPLDAGTMPVPGTPTQTTPAEPIGASVPATAPATAPAPSTSVPSPVSAPSPAPAVVPGTVQPSAPPARAPQATMQQSVPPSPPAVVTRPQATMQQSMPPSPPVAVPRPQAQTQSNNPYLAAVTSPPVQAKPPAQPAAVQGMLRFSTDDESWVQVVDGAGKRSSQLIMRGSPATISGTPPFQIVVGNAAVVSLRYNDQNIDLRPHTGVKVARLTLQ